MIRWDKTKFRAKVVRQATYSLAIIIPAINCREVGIEEGDYVECKITRHEKTEAKKGD